MKALLILFTAILLFGACKKDDDKGTPYKPVGNTTPPADSTGI